MAFSLGTIIYVALLLTNAIAILSEERFLAKSKSVYPSSSFIQMQSRASPHHHLSTIRIEQLAGQRIRLNKSLPPRTPGSARFHRTTTTRTLDPLGL